MSEDDSRGARQRANMLLNASALFRWYEGLDAQKRLGEGAYVFEALERVVVERVDAEILEVFGFTRQETFAPLLPVLFDEEAHGGFFAGLASLDVEGSRVRFVGGGRHRSGEEVRFTAIATRLPDARVELSLGFQRERSALPGEDSPFWREVLARAPSPVALARDGDLIWVNEAWRAADERACPRVGAALDEGARELLAREASDEVAELARSGQVRWRVRHIERDGEVWKIITGATAAAPVEAAPAEEEPVEEVSAEEQGPRRVLLVDDDEIVRAAVKRGLERKNFEVICADSGARALELVERERFDVTVLDVMMPGMTGEVALDELRARRPRLPVLVYSGYADLDILERLESFERVSFLQKPFRNAALIAKIDELLSS